MSRKKHRLQSTSDTFLQRPPALLPRIKLTSQNGRFHIDGLDAWYHHWRDPYHLLLTLPWSLFLLGVSGIYITLNLLFATLYWMGGDAIANAQPGSFWDAFFFSVQTFASIGYGAMYPQTPYAHIVVTLEAIISIISIALLTGLTFARFTRSTARILFSQYAVVMPFHGVPTLMVRVANQRRNQIQEGQVQMYLLRDEIDEDGHFMRRIHDLPLSRNQAPNFVLSWTLMHPLDATSPLYGASATSLQQTRSEILVLVQGIDGTISQPVHANHSYTGEEILWNYKFVDIFHTTEQGDRYLDLNNFHQVEPLLPEGF
jgi:inward rectifier potassium channel